MAFVAVIIPVVVGQHFQLKLKRLIILHSAGMQLMVEMEQIAVNAQQKYAFLLTM